MNKLVMIFLTTVTSVIFSVNVYANEEDQCFTIYRDYEWVSGHGYKYVGLHDLCFENTSFTNILKGKFAHLTKIKLYKVNDDTYEQEEFLLSGEFLVTDYKNALQNNGERCGHGYFGVSKLSVKLEERISGVKPQSKLEIMHEKECLGFHKAFRGHDEILINGKKLKFNYNFRELLD